MSDQAFYQFYLQEIGVHTPISFSADEAAAVDQAPRVPEAVREASQPSREVASKAAEPSATEAPVPKPVAEAPKVPMVTLDDLARQASVCERCSLAQTRTQVVFGTGNPHADIVFIGEAPGRDEDLRGEPFVGRAGQLLDRMLAAVELDRSSAYIMNTIKCRPPQNRDPKPEEIEACQPWFDSQLQLLKPKMICLLGRVAAQSVLQSDAPLGSMRGRWHDYHGIPVWVTYHPAYLLRSPEQKKRGWEDLQVMRRKLDALQGEG